MTLVVHSAVEKSAIFTNGFCSPLGISPFQIPDQDGGTTKEEIPVQGDREPYN